MGKHQRDGLRVLVMNEFCKLLRVGLLNCVERCGFGSEGFGEPVQKTLGVFGFESLHEQLPCEVNTASGNVIPGTRDVMKLFENRFRLLGGYGGELGDFATDPVYVLF